MSQVSGNSVSADQRSAWHALRPMLILGGFAAVWWALMTGTAHAEGPQHHLLDQVRSHAKAHHDSPLRSAVRRVHHDAAPAVAHVRSHARSHIQPVTQPAADIVRATPVAPVATDAVRTVRAKVSGTIAKTRSLLQQAADRNLVGTVREHLTKTNEKPESSTGQGNSHSRRHLAKRSTSSSSHQLLSMRTVQSAPTSGADDNAAAVAGDHPLDGPGATPPVRDPATSPSGSDSISFTPVGTTESSLLVVPSVQRDLSIWRLARLPGGPAYQPGSSPD